MEKKYPALNIQWPITQLILSGKKTVETRTYPIPQKYLNVDLIVVETPGSKGKFKARMVAIVRFTSQIEYTSEREFYLDSDRHCVTPNSEWAWTAEKGKWGWVIGKITPLKKAIPAPNKRGIAFTKEVCLEKK